jgi:hypothetical protein
MAGFAAAGRVTTAVADDLNNKKKTNTWISSSTTSNARLSTTARVKFLPAPWGNTESL